MTKLKNTNCDTDQIVREKKTLKKSNQTKFKCDKILKKKSPKKLFYKHFFIKNFVRKNLFTKQLSFSPKKKFQTKKKTKKKIVKTFAPMNFQLP